MRKLGDDIVKVVSELGAKNEALRISMRTQQVRERYRAAIEAVYGERGTAELHLAHTNNVIIKNKAKRKADTSNNASKEDRGKTLVVYVDDSLFAAELNAQRELIKLHLLEQFNEEIDEFEIYVSKWKKYRENHPYIDSNSDADAKKVLSVPLDSNEKSFVSNTVSKVDDERIRKSLEKAMTADIEWKKGERV